LLSGRSLEVSRTACMSSKLAGYSVELQFALDVTYKRKLSSTKLDHTAHHLPDTRAVVSSVRSNKPKVAIVRPIYVSPDR